MIKPAYPFLFGLLLILSSCGGTKIAADYNKDKDFTAYKTFNFLQWNPDNAKEIDKVEQERIYKVITEELEARGLQKVDYGADLAVNVIAIISKDRKYHATYNLYIPMGFTYYYGYGYVDGTAYTYGNYYSPYSVQEFDKLHGGLIIDIFDIHEKKQVWQGSALGKVSADENKRSLGGPKAIESIFKHFPIEP